MSSKKVKLKSVERNTRKNTRSSRNNPVKPAKKQNQAVNKTDDIDFDEFNRKRIEEARKANVIVLSEIKKSLEEKKEPEPKKTFKDPLWYIGTGVLWLFDTCNTQNRDCDEDRNNCKTKEEAEAFLALMQLKRLWHEYVDNYSEKVDDCYCITCVCSSNGNDFSILYIGSATYNMDLFKFPSKELAEEFLYNFKDLFMKISPLWN